MLGIDRVAGTDELTGEAGRDRAAKVAAAAATIAAGWDRLETTEVDRLAEALEDHAASYLDWIGCLRSPSVDEVRAAVTTIRSANATLREGGSVRGRDLALVLGQAASHLVDRVNRAARAHDDVVDLDRA